MSDTMTEITHQTRWSAELIQEAVQTSDEALVLRVLRLLDSQTVGHLAAETVSEELGREIAAGRYTEC